MGELTNTTKQVIEPGEGQGFATTRVEDLLCNALRLRAFSWNIATPWAARCNWSHDIYLRNE